MANAGANPVECAVSFTMRLAVSMILPAWGAIMALIGVRHGEGWWIASGAAVFAVGMVFLAGSSIVTPFLPGARPSPDRATTMMSREAKR